jgi:hypothetical protein
VSARWTEEGVLAAFTDITTLPGSRKLRRARDPKAVNKLFGESDAVWDASPAIKRIGGRDVEVFTISALAAALGKSLVTIRQWEQKAYLPQAPYRLRQKSLKGQKTAGNRVYSRRLIEAAIDEFGKRGLLGKARVEWKHHMDLTIAIASRWDRIFQDESTPSEE